jgi:hypothetical protein
MMAAATQDVRIAPLPADPNFYDGVGADAVIDAQSEKMVCISMTYNGPEMAFDYFEPHQGKWGHHAVFFAPKPEYVQPDGTIVDCTAASYLAQMDVLTVTEDNMLPKGYGTHLHAGQHMVIQSHYINTSDHPIEVRDIVRLHVMPSSQVTTWTSPITGNDININVPPNATGSLQFDCVVPQDMFALQMGGHMHEWGSQFTIQIGPDVDHLTQVYDVPAWKPEYRDAPPVNISYGSPISLPKGTIIRSTCTWTNTTTDAIGYPKEMCVDFGLVYPLETPWTCNVDFASK